MKKPLNIIILFISIFLLSVSCRQEEDPIFIGEIPSLANSSVAGLLERTVLNDGSIDNIIDQSNCFTVQLPVNVSVNGRAVLVNTEDDYALIEAIFDEFDDDTDVLEIIFPITVVLTDFTEVVVNNQNEFLTLSASCTGENVPDEDIECIDIQYPIVTSIFNQVTENFETLTITSDIQLYIFLNDLENNDIVEIDFPITVVFNDGSTQSIGDLEALEDVLDSAVDSCDEDDDYDYNDDDCDSCSTSQLADVLTGCDFWTLDKLERNDNDLEDLYVAYQFTFLANGTLNVTENTNNYSGTWASSGSGNNIDVTITIPDLTDFNANWVLHEIEQNGTENNVDLRIGEDRLRFESNCITGNNGNENTGVLATTLADGLWVVGSYTEDADDQTSNYNGYTFNFDLNGTVVADNGNPINGTWSTLNSGTELQLNFGNTSPLDQFNDTWNVISFTATQVEVRDVSGGNGGIDTLIFNKQ